jgi:hypothetical protein
MSRTQALARDALTGDLTHPGRGDWTCATLADVVPAAWHMPEADLDAEEPREKVTLYLDRSVARFYRGMGRGCHARINRLLPTWAQMKIAGEVQLVAYLAKRVAGKREEGGATPAPGRLPVILGLDQRTIPPTSSSGQARG